MIRIGHFISRSYKILQYSITRMTLNEYTFSFFVVEGLEVNRELHKQRNEGYRRRVLPNKFLA